MATEPMQPLTDEDEDDDWRYFVRPPYPLVTGPEADLPDVWDGSIEHLQIEEDMPQSLPQDRSLTYLRDVVEWVVRAQPHCIMGDVPIFPLGARRRYDWLAADIAVFLQPPVPVITPIMKSYRIRLPDNPPPTVVFEVASEKTWKRDISATLTGKPQRYANMGASEYYAYDPYVKRLWPKGYPRLLGWQLLDGQMVARKLDAEGRLWSAALDSFLVPDGELLRLIDRAGVMRLTGDEAAGIAQAEVKIERRARAAAERARSIAERARKRAEAAAEIERAARAAANSRVEIERAARADAEAQIAALEARLRAAGLDPA